jgi:hypothetical protein
VSSSHSQRSSAARSVVAVAALLTLALLGSAGAGAGPPPTPAPRFSEQLQRIVSARVHHTRISTVRNTNARRVGNSLASLRPTWVSGLIRYARGQHPVRGEVRAWRKITGLVRAASPQAQFDVVLNAKQYRDGDELMRMMSRIRAKLDNDGWFFDFYSKAYRKRPRMIKAAIEWAHAHGEWVGGNVFGLARHDRPLPMRSDYLSVQDFHLKLDVDAVQRLAARIPVTYHLHNDPDNPHGGGCRFIERFSTARRLALIRHRARQQVPYGFRVSYPALFPECIRPPRGGRPGFLFSYNAFRDPPMAATILELLDRYD